ncbi:MAG: alkaline phosphatase [Gemmatimonadota bacterium]|nr:MAG: alkaline phosphatase [Gemmatimonadota bacterium]
MTRRRSVVALPLMAITASFAALTTPVEAQDTPTRIILFIADGTGVGYWTAAAFAADNLAVQQFPVMGLVDTRASNSKVTDSAAAATAYSAGVMTYNGAIGVDPDTNVVTTVIEVAQRRGMATGLVATSSITHATPAAFAAHVPSRNMEWEIARQLVGADVTVILGGGRKWFDPARRPDSLDLLSDITAGYTYVETAQELGDVRTNSTEKLFGLFAVEHMPSARMRIPTLPVMTRSALEVLNNDPDGFFLMVEASQPDWRGHDHESIGTIAAEVLDLDRAIAVALEYQQRHPETLIVVTADHETGGLAIQQAGSRRLLTRAAAAADSTVAQIVEASEVSDPELAALADSARWYMARLARNMRDEARHMGDSSALVARYTTTGHTAQMVPLFASGPGAEVFGGLKPNWRIGELLLQVVRR